MQRHRATLVLGLLAAVTVWGCAQSGSGSQVKQKMQLLEEELANLQQQASVLRKELKEVKTERDRLIAEVQQLRGLTRQLQEVKEQLNERTKERDQALTQLQQMRKGVKELVHQLELLASEEPARGEEVRLATTP